MKTNKICAIILAALFPVVFSCENPEVDTTVAVDVTIRTATILTPFSAYDSSNFGMYSDDDGVAHLRVSCFLYDYNGSLIDEQSYLQDDFEKESHIRGFFDGDEDGLLVVVASCIQGSLTNPSYEAYSISGKGSLSTLKVEQVFSVSFGSSWSFLGIGMRDLRAGMGPVTLSLAPATALIYGRYESIHSKSNVDNYILYWLPNDYMSFKASGYDCARVSTTYYKNELSPDNYPSSAHIYTYFNCLPGKISLAARTYTGNTYSQTNDLASSVTAGHQYVFNYDCSTNSISFREGVMSRAAEDDGEPFVFVQKTK